jgi:hypothetical protein
MGNPRDEDRSFKVVDRRSFDAEGNLRAEEALKKDAGASAQGPPPPEPAGPPEEMAASDSPEATAYHVGESADAFGPLDFSQFILSLAQLAFAFLGDLPSPQTGRRERNIGAAKQQIDLLGLLREKSEGNRTPEENQLIETLLYELHRRFVEVVREQAQPARRS